MPSFAYKAYLPNGSSETGVVEAKDTREAGRKLSRAEKLAFHLAELGTSGVGTAEDRTLRFGRRANLARIFADLSALLNAGFNISSALEVVTASETANIENKRLKAAGEALADGKPFSAALASWPETKPDMLAMVAAGESSGKLGEVINRLSDNLNQQALRRSQLIEALLYPAFLLAMVVAAIFFLALFLVPAIDPIFETGSVAKPIAIKILSGFGESIRSYWPLLISAAGGLGILIVLGSPRTWISRVQIRLPFIGPLLVASASATYLHCLSLLAKTGVPILQALKLAAMACPNADMQERLLSVQTNVANGERLTFAFEKAGVFDASTLSLIALGEESNNLSPLTERAAILLEAQSKRKLDRMATFLTPAITIILGLLVGGLVISVMTALLSINDAAIQ
jgi:general secretion pathway protein F